MYTRRRRFRCGGWGVEWWAGRRSGEPCNGDVGGACGCMGFRISLSLSLSLFYPLTVKKKNTYKDL